MSEIQDQDKSVESNAPLHLSDQELAALQLQLAEDLKQRFKANLEAFSKFMPDVTAAFASYTPKKRQHFFCTENGIPNLMFPDDNGRFFYNCANPWEDTENDISRILKTQPVHMTSYPVQYDPYGQIYFRYNNEAARLSAEFTQKEGNQAYTPGELGSIPNLAILGVGLGYPLGVFCSQIEIGNLLAIEPDPDIFFASLKAFDWASLLKYIQESGMGFKLIVGQSSDRLLSILREFYRSHGVFLSGAMTAYVHYLSPDIKACGEVLGKDYYLLHASMGFFDDHMFGTSHGLQAALKGCHFMRRDTVLPPRMRHWPLFVIGNGPSLDHDIPFLRANQDRAVIIACGTALDTLYHAGIKPDFYAATERTPEISETLDAIPDQEFKDSLTLIAADVIHPLTVSRFKHTALFGKPDEPYYWFVAGHLPEKERPREIDVMNPFVGNLGIATIFGFGFNNVYLFGLDCGRKLTDDSQTAMHSKYSTVYGAAGVNDKGGNYAASKDQNDVYPGNFGGMVQGNKLFRESRRLMEQAIVEHAYFRNETFRICNCSDGAAIAGTIPMHSEKVQLSKKKIIDKQELLKFVEERLTFVPSYTRDDISKITEQEMFQTVADKLQALFKEKPVSRLELVRRMMTASEFLHAMTLNRWQAGLAYFLHGSAQSMFIIADFVLYRIKDEAEAIENAWLILRRFRYFLDDAKRIYPLLPDYVLGKHYHFMDGKVGWDHEDSPAPKAPPYPHLFKKEFDDPQKKFVKRYE